MSDQYDFREVEAKWQARWEKDQVHRAQAEAGKSNFYGLEFFPYPSGDGLSVGHFRNYVPSDAACRYRSMRGYNVLHPMGWDAFGLPAEREAIRKQRSPREMVREYAANYRRQLKLGGIAYDWSREINSSDPEFYHWTQWFFLLLYKRGLAYRTNQSANWCPSCETGLAREEVKEGRCWRCGTLIEKKPMPQWFFKITEYADRLLSDLDRLDWPESTKKMQREWIGRSEGAEVVFPIMGEPVSSESMSEGAIHVFTTRPDTLFGATFMVLAPEHPLVETITTASDRADVEAYVEQSQRTSEIDRLSAERTKTGVFTGAYARNPVNGEAIPVWIADYVLMGYGTGAIMAVPAHDQRDFEFARKYDIPIRLVYQIKDGPRTPDEMTEALPEGGVVINSGPFNGLPNNSDTVHAFVKWLETSGMGKGMVMTRLRDWLISRQRYWGAPIPMIHCERCGEVPVPEDKLPVLLPDVQHYEPTGTGESPLAAMPEFVNTRCPQCGGSARRETDTMSGFACSSWYFLRFADPHNDNVFASPEALKTWLPVDLYVGGAEHAVMHLLYARFWTKVMYDARLLDFEEPFLTLRHQGMVLIETPGRRPTSGEAGGEESEETVIDWVVLKPEERGKVPEDEWVWRWAKMSKSSGNVITPDEMAEQYGADSLRVYEMFVAPFEETVQWTDSGIQGASRFLHRVWRLYRDSLVRFTPGWPDEIAASDLSPADRKLRRKLHQTIQKVGQDIEGFSFNTAVAALMELVNEMYAYVQGPGAPGSGRNADVTLSEALDDLALLIAPLAPHLADELREQLGHAGYAYHASWPVFDAAAAVDEEITYVIQLNGKLIDRITLPASTTDEEAKEMAISSDRAVSLTQGKTIRKVIVVPRKLVNIVAG
ncbi:MAG TPA: leucine--tRNA ligase [Armatimonadota bacterium]|nr:leucine--tRNA ligase [Armatimonadota bacterium]